MPLVKRVFALTPPQDTWLTERASVLGITTAELSRRIMDAARGEMGELLLASNKAPAILGAVTPQATAPTERSAAILELMRYCQEHKIPEARITELLTKRVYGADWRQADANDYRSVLFTLRYGSDPPLFDPGEQPDEQAV
jgi:hypothetical protein